MEEALDVKMWRRRRRRRGREGMEESTENITITARFHSRNTIDLCIAVCLLLPINRAAALRALAGD